MDTRLRLGFDSGSGWRIGGGEGAGTCSGFWIIEFVEFSGILPLELRLTEEEEVVVVKVRR